MTHCLLCGAFLSKAETLDHFENNHPEHKLNTVLVVWGKHESQQYIAIDDPCVELIGP